MSNSLTSASTAEARAKAVVEAWWVRQTGTLPSAGTAVEHDLVELVSEFAVALHAHAESARAEERESVRLLEAVAEVARGSLPYLHADHRNGLRKALAALELARTPAAGTAIRARTKARAEERKANLGVWSGTGGAGGSAERNKADRDWLLGKAAKAQEGAK